MRKFLRHICLFALLIILIAIGLEIIAESIPNSYTYKRAYMDAHAPQIKTLILGSSYAYDGLAPSELPEAFNLANSSQTLEDDYRLLAKYIGSMDSLRTVLLGVGYGIWSDRSEAYRRCYYTIYMDLYPRWPLNRYSFEVFNPQLLAKKIIKYAISRDVTRCDSLGQRVGHTLEAAQSGAEWWNKGVDALVANDRLKIGNCRLAIEENTQYLKEIVDLCNAHNVRPVIVLMPVMEEYKRLLPKEQVALMNEVLLSLGGSVICIDASEWEIPADGWYNATHLTKEASEEFTRQLIVNSEN